MSYKAPPVEEKVKLAGDDSKDRLYEPKQNKKVVRILTVIAYIFCVSLAAIMLSMYYVFLWDPKIKLPHRPSARVAPPADCHEPVIQIPKPLTAANLSEISQETFYKMSSKAKENSVQEKYFEPKQTANDKKYNVHVEKYEKLTRQYPPSRDDNLFQDEEELPPDYDQITTDINRTDLEIEIE